MDGSQTNLIGFTERAACERLLHDYAWTQDHGDAEGFASLFSADAEWRRPGREPLRGRAAILANARESFRQSSDEKLLHAISNIRLDASGNALSSTCYSLAFQSRDDGRGYATDCTPVAAMIYRNRFIQEDGRWSIALHATEFLFRRA